MRVLKHLVALLVFSILFVLCMPFIHQAAESLVHAHSWMTEHLRDFFNGSQPMDMIRDLIALLALPLIIGLIPAFLYWLVRRQWLAAFLPIVWAVWLLEVGILSIALARTAV